MTLRCLLLAIVLVAQSFTAERALASAIPSVRYYENGKQIPTPLQVPPIYPVKEFKRRIGGTAIIAFGYDRYGKVVSASVKRSSGNRNLDAAALAAVRQWTVAPVVKDGQPLAGESESPVTFTP